jgi:hypothetical protein
MVQARFPQCLRDTRDDTLSEAMTGSSCSQILMTRQPASVRTPSVSRSRSTLAASFAFHHARFDFGNVPWSGQRCQKQPSTSTATRAAGNTMSTLRRRPSTARSTRNLSPSRWSSRRSASSGRVSRRGCEDIRALTSGLLGVIVDGELRGALVTCAAWHDISPQAPLE